MNPRVLVVDDEVRLARLIAQTLGRAGYECEVCGDGASALEAADARRPDVVVTDCRMPGMDGLQLLRELRSRHPDLPVILVTGHGDVELAVTSMQEGAYDFVEKPYAPARLIGSVRRALDKRRLTLENRALRNRVGGRDAIETRLLGRSDAMGALRRQLRAVAATEADVLITG